MNGFSIVRGSARNPLSKGLETIFSNSIKKLLLLMTIRLNKVTRDLNVGISTVVDFLQKKGYSVEANPNAKITDEQYALLVKAFSKDKDLKIESEKISQGRQGKDRAKASAAAGAQRTVEIETKVPEDIRPKFKPVGKIDLDSLRKKKGKPAVVEPAEEPVKSRKEVADSVVEAGSEVHTSELQSQR